MKKAKMTLMLKRIPTDGLYDLFHLLVEEINSRKNAYKKLPEINFTSEEVKVEC